MTICDHWAMRCKVESTSASKDGWGLLYLPTSAKAVTRRGTVVGLLYKERQIQVLDSDTNVFRALEDTKVLLVVKLLLEFNELVAGILREAAFPLRGLDGAHVDLCMVRAWGTIVTWELRIKHRVVLFE